MIMETEAPCACKRREGGAEAGRVSPCRGVAVFQRGYRLIVRFMARALMGVTLLGVLAVGSCAVSNKIADVKYARSFWGDKVGVEKVIASKRWHTLFLDDWFACTYAVVAIDEASAARIREEGPDAVIGHLDWRPTPAPKPADRGENYIDSFECADETGGLRERVEAALGAPGSWYFLELEAAYLLAPEARLAAKFRYGD